MCTFRILSGICTVLLFATSASAVGESAVITLVFPYGARQYGMGEVGVAIADDATATYFNPAGLAMPSRRFQGGEASYFYEPLLPAFGITDLYHNAQVACFQPFWEELGGFALSRNYVNFGENSWTDDLGRELGKAHSFEVVYGLSWGFRLSDAGLQNHAAGVSIKYVHSALAPGFGPGEEGVGRTFAIDAGYRYCHPWGMRAALVMANMGPSIFYISRAERDPIPFTLKAAVGFKRELVVRGVHFAALACEFLVNREVVTSYPDKPPDSFVEALYTDFADKSLEENARESIVHAGYEVCFFNTFFVRTGIMLDREGYREEVHHGLGISVLDHVDIDWAWIESPSGSIARDGQWQFSVSVHGISHWRLDDMLWWFRPQTGEEQWCRRF